MGGQRSWPRAHFTILFDQVVVAVVKLFASSSVDQEKMITKQY